MIAEGSTVGTNNDFNTTDYEKCDLDMEANFDAGDTLHKFILSDTLDVLFLLTSEDAVTPALHLIVMSNTTDEEGIDCPDTCVTTVALGTPLNVTQMLMGTYWLIIDGNNQDEGSYNLQVRCPDAFNELICGEITSGSTINRVSNFDSMSYNDIRRGCEEITDNNFHAGDCVYRFVLTEEMASIDFVMTKDNPDMDLFLMASIPSGDVDPIPPAPDVCLVRSTGGTDTEQITRNDLIPGVYWLIVDGGITDGVNAEGNFTLSAACTNDYGTISCLETLEGNTAQRVNYNEEYSDCTGGTGYVGGDYAYEIVVQPGDDFTFTLDPTEGDDLDLMLFNAIGPSMGSSTYQPNFGSCIQISDTATVGDIERIDVDLAAGHYFVVVDGQSTTTDDGTVPNQGPFNLTVSCASLPVELVSFAGIPTSEGIEIVWETASEIDFEGFHVQKSQDGEHWQNVHWQPALGSISSFTTYKFIDENPLAGTNFFRLQALDIDGSLEYSKIIEIHYDGPVSDINIFPTLVQNQVTITGIAPGEKAQYEIRSMLGQLLHIGNVESGESVDISALANGVMYFTVLDNAKAKTVKIMKL